MPDLPALDVAIGLVFLYVVLALVCTTINESISTTVGLRARFLQLGILNLLSASSGTTKAGIETTKRFYGHPLVQGLIRPGRGPDPSLDPTDAGRWWRKPPYPSYLPSRTFVAALTDMAREAEAKLDQVDPDEAAAPVPGSKTQRRAGALARCDSERAALGGDARALPLGGRQRCAVPACGGAVVRRLDGTRLRVVQAKGPADPLRDRDSGGLPPERRHAHGRAGALAGRRHPRSSREEGRGSGAREPTSGSRRRSGNSIFPSAGSSRSVRGRRSSRTTSWPGCRSSPGWR